jgi:hypothetical protein
MIKKSTNFIKRPINSPNLLCGGVFHLVLSVKDVITNIENVIRWGKVQAKLCPI